MIKPSENQSQVEESKEHLGNPLIKYLPRRKPSRFDDFDELGGKQISVRTPRYSRERKITIPSCEPSLGWPNAIVTLNQYDKRLKKKSGPLVLSNKLMSIHEE